MIRELETLGLNARCIDTSWWADSVEIFAPIQASEAARLHAGHYDQVEPIIRDRLKWGASLKPDEVAALRKRQAEFQTRMDDLFATHELVLLPAIPVAKLTAGANQTQTRHRMLRYTAPISLPGAPAIAIPCAHGGMQLAAAREADESLLELAAQIGAQRKAAPARFLIG